MMILWIMGFDTISRKISLRDASYSGLLQVAGDVIEGFGEVQKIRFCILSVYKGIKYDDTGISEIIFDF